jgi:hypothetical protein
MAICVGVQFDELKGSSGHWLPIQLPNCGGTPQTKHHYPGASDVRFAERMAHQTAGGHARGSQRYIGPGFPSSSSPFPRTIAAASRRLSAEPVANSFW